MWIQFKKDYSGPLGLFFKGEKKDLPETMIKKLDKKYYQKTCAPWDEHKDLKAELKSNAKSAIAWADVVADKAKELNSKLNDLVKPLKDKQTEFDQADKLAREAVKKAENKNASNEIKKEAHGLVVAAEKANAELSIVQGEFMIAEGKYDLARLEAEDAKRKAIQLAEEAGIKYELPEDATNTKGQTVQAGQES